MKIMLIFFQVLNESEVKNVLWKKQKYRLKQYLCNEKKKNKRMNENGKLKWNRLQDGEKKSKWKEGIKSDCIRKG